MSRSTISTFRLFEMFPTEDSARTYLEGRPPELDRITDAVLSYRPKDKQPKRPKKKRKPNAMREIMEALRQ